MNQVFIIFGDGRRIGLSTAPSAAVARKNALSAFSRFTASKDGAICDYGHIEAVALQPAPSAAASLAGILTCALPQAGRFEQALALGFRSIEEMDEHQLWLAQHGSPGYLRWLANVREQAARAAVIVIDN